MTVVSELGLCSQRAFLLGSEEGGREGRRDREGGMVREGEERRERGGEEEWEREGGRVGGRKGEGRVY